jgi:hypothetical protein
VGARSCASVRPSTPTARPHIVSTSSRACGSVRCTSHATSPPAVSRATTSPFEIVVANSRCRVAIAVSCISAALQWRPSGPMRSNVAVASVTTAVRKPRFEAMRVVVETQWSVVSPQITTWATLATRSRRLRSVPMTHC